MKPSLALLLQIIPNNMMYIYLLCVLGFLLSLYATYCHIQINKDGSFQSVCDLSDRASCTKAFKSEYGTTLGIPNGIHGMIFYVLVAALYYLGYIEYVWYLSILSVAGSAVLAYILYFKVKSLCVVCMSIYAVNIALLIVMYLQHIQ